VFLTNPGFPNFFRVRAVLLFEKIINLQLNSEQLNETKQIMKILRWGSFYCANDMGSVSKLKGLSKSLNTKFKNV